MTTNSPNPVDGNVQALIADCQAEIAELEKRLTTWGEEWIPYLQSKLKRQQVALAALKEAPASITNDMALAFHSATSDSSIGADDVEEIKNGLRAAFANFTTPPAQLLRPVELPPKSDVKMGGDAKTRALLTGMNMMLKSCTEALRQQGYEVKND